MPLLLQISQKPIHFLHGIRSVLSWSLLKCLMWLARMNLWSQLQVLHVSLNYNYWLQKNYSVRIFLTRKYPFERYWLSVFGFRGASLCQNICLPWQKIIHFRNCGHFPLMSIWPCHCFLECLGIFSSRRNRRTARPLDFFVFLFHNHNDYGVSCHFIVTLDDWLVHPWHNWVILCIYLLHCNQHHILKWRVCVSVFRVVYKLWWLLQNFVQPHTFSLIKD